MMPLGVDEDEDEDRGAPASPFTPFDRPLGLGGSFNSGGDGDLSFDWSGGDLQQRRRSSTAAAALVMATWGDRRRGWRSGDDQSVAVGEKAKTGDVDKEDEEGGEGGGGGDLLLVELRWDRSEEVASTEGQW